MKQKHADKFTDNELIEAYQRQPVLGKLAAQFNVPQITIFRRAERLGLKFKIGGNHAKIDLQEILDGLHPHYQTLKLKRRLVEQGIKKNECEICGITEWMEKPIVMQLDHINGDSHDHRLANLRMVCPNCHSQTSTYCGKNMEL